jgi:hypothetical protein
MQENASVSELTRRQRAAVELLVLDELSDEAIAQQIGVNPATLYRWKKLPDFEAAMRQARDEIIAALRLEGIANKQNRIDAQVERWNALEAIRRARMADPTLKQFPGSEETGFVTAELKLVKVLTETDEGTEVSYREFWQHGFDTGLWNAYLSVEKMTAQETGQWEDKLNVGGSLERTYIIVTETDGDE